MVFRVGKLLFFERWGSAGLFCLFYERWDWENKKGKKSAAQRWEKTSAWWRWEKTTGALGSVGLGGMQIRQRSVPIFFGMFYFIG